MSDSDHIGPGRRRGIWVPLALALLLAALASQLQPIIEAWWPHPPSETTTAELDDAELRHVITRAHLTCLHRPPYPPGMRGFVQALRETPRSEAWVHEQLMNSGERVGPKWRYTRDKSRDAFKILSAFCLLLFITDLVAVRRTGRHLIPTHGLLVFLVVWWLTFVVNGYTFLRALHPDTPLFMFPISIGYYKDFAPSLWAGAFALVLAAAVWLADRLNAVTSIAAAVLLTLLAALAGGSWPNVFTDPALLPGSYFLSPVEDWGRFLAEFNTVQHSLGCHPGTHPPFGVLLTDLVYRLAGGNTVVMSVALAAIGLSAIPLVWVLLRKAADLPPKMANLAVLLFGAMPAFAIYAVYSLDATILACSLPLLIGILFLQRGRAVLGGGLIALGLTATSLLTFGSLFLVGVLGVVGLVSLVRRDWGSVTAITAAGLVSLAVLGALIPLTGYNHFAAFLTASKLENPLGFMGAVAPIPYALTRIEGILEILLFASIPLAGLLLAPRRLGPSHISLLKSETYVAFAGIAVLLGMFMTGAYRTGETARACLYIYPYLWLLLKGMNTATLKTILLCAGAQTLYMQTTIFFIW